MLFIVSCGFRDKIKEKQLSLYSIDVIKGDQRIDSTYTSLRSDGDGSVTSGVFFVKRGRLGDRDLRCLCYPFGDKA
jgi:hypothetical protein